METKKYQALLKAVELGSITAAAQELDYSPSGLTRVLDSLEKELGFPVLFRGPQGVEFTREGKAIVPKLREILRYEAQIEEYCASLQGLVKGELYIGSYYSIATQWLPTILKRFQEDYPGIRVHVQEAGNRSLQDALNQRDLQCCLYNKPDNYEGDWIPLYSDRLTAWIPKSHPLAKKRALDPMDLHGMPFIEALPHQKTDTGAFLKKYGVIPKILFTTSDMYTCWTMVEAGLGLSIDNELSSRRWKGNVKVVPFKVPDRIELGIALPSAKEASPALKKFIEYVKEYVAKEYGEKMTDDR